MTNLRSDLVFELLYVDSSRAAAQRNSGLNLRKLLGALDYLDDGRQDGQDLVFSYFNEDTQVKARFIIYPAGHDDELGLAFELDLPCPTFCALEALPAALCLAREKELDVEVLRANGSVQYAKPSFEELLKEWQLANALAVNAKKAAYSRGEAIILEAMWEFSLVRSDLARRYGRLRVPVPPLYPVLHKRSGRVGRMVDWHGLDKVVLGESDWVRLVDPPKPLVNGAIYPAAELTLACKPLVRTVPQPIFHYLCEKNKIAGDLIGRIMPLKKSSMRSFQNLSLGQYYDEAGLII